MSDKEAKICAIIMAILIVGFIIGWIGVILGWWEGGVEYEQPRIWGPLGIE